MSGPKSTKDLIVQAHNEGLYTENETEVLVELWEDSKKITEESERQKYIMKELMKKFGPARPKEMFKIIIDRTKEHKRQQSQNVQQSAQVKKNSQRPSSNPINSDPARPNIPTVAGTGVGGSGYQASNIPQIPLSFQVHPIPYNTAMPSSQLQPQLAQQALGIKPGIPFQSQTGYNSLQQPQGRQPTTQTSGGPQAPNIPGFPTPVTSVPIHHRQTGASPTPPQYGNMQAQGQVQGQITSHSSLPPTQSHYPGSVSSHSNNHPQAVTQTGGQSTNIGSASIILPPDALLEPLPKLPNELRDQLIEVIPRTALAEQEELTRQDMRAALPIAIPVAELVNTSHAPHRWRVDNIIDEANIIALAKLVLGNKPSNSNNSNNNNSSVLDTSTNTKHRQDVFLSPEAIETLSSGLQLYAKTLLEESHRLSRKRRNRTAISSYTQIIHTVLPPRTGAGNRTFPLPDSRLNMGMKFGPNVRFETQLMAAAAREDVALMSNRLEEVLTKELREDDIERASTRGVIGTKRRIDTMQNDEDRAWWSVEKRSLSEGLLSPEEIVLYQLKLRLATRKKLGPSFNSGGTLTGASGVPPGMIFRPGGTQGEVEVTENQIAPLDKERQRQALQQHQQRIDSFKEDQRMPFCEPAEPEYVSVRDALQCIALHAYARGSGRHTPRIGHSLHLARLGAHPSFGDTSLPSSSSPLEVPVVSGNQASNQNISGNKPLSSLQNNQSQLLLAQRGWPPSSQQQQHFQNLQSSIGHRV